MDYRSNVTYITFGGYVEVHKYRYLYFVVMFMVYMLIISSNVTIVFIIMIHKNLHEPMYIFIAALLINSVLFSTAIYPKLLIDFLSDKQIISYSACLLQWFCSHWLAVSDFFLLSFMAYDRYVSICNPLQYTTIMQKTTVNIFLCSAWILPACVVSVLILLNAKKEICKFHLKGILCNSSVQTLQCVKSRIVNIYGLFLVTFLFLPVLFILFSYSRILVVSYRCKGVRRRAAQTCLPHLLVLINFTCLISYSLVLDQLELDSPKTVRLIMTIQAVTYQPLFNPIIYGLKMRRIYDHLKKLFCRMVQCLYTDESQRFVS